jgi:hypothetical protein
MVSERQQRRNSSDYNSGRPKNHLQSQQLVRASISSIDALLASVVLHSRPFLVAAPDPNRTRPPPRRSARALLRPQLVAASAIDRQRVAVPIASKRQLRAGVRRRAWAQRE